MPPNPRSGRRYRTDSRDLPFHPPASEASWTQDTRDVMEVLLRAVPFHLFRIHRPDMDLAVVGDATVGDRLGQALIRVLQLQILPDHSDRHARLRLLDLADDLLPCR